MMNYFIVRLLFFSQILRLSVEFSSRNDMRSNSFNRVYKISISKELDSSNDVDYYDKFTWFDKLLFQRFSLAVATELGASETPKSYKELISTINRLSFTSNPDIVNISSKQMLVRLFPSWLLPMYKAIFSNLFPSFSEWMNAWVTHWTTNWLMGNSTIGDLESNGIVNKDRLLVIEKCRFLEESGCIQTCLHACKIPTQNFFYEEMGLPVSLKPNLTDYSCRFEFGVRPIPLDLDESVQNSPCLDVCGKSNKFKSSCYGCK